MERPDATIAPMCTMGPSRPSGSAVATTIVMPKTLATSVEKRSSPGERQPLRKALTPGSPDAIACGQMMQTNAAPETRPTLIPRYVKNAAGRRGEGAAGEPAGRRARGAPAGARRVCAPCGRGSS